MAKRPKSAFLRATERLQQLKIVGFLRRQPPINYAFAAALVLVVAYVVMFIITALNNALLFDGYAADGAFQMLNPLRRLAAGEAAGSDFNVFHGVGVPLLHLPFYLLFGQGLFASELTRWLLSPAVFMLTTYGFLWAYMRRVKVAVIGAVVITWVAMNIMPLFVLPFTSMLGIRSFVPVILAILMMRQERFRKPITSKIAWLAWLSWYELLAATLLAVGVLCGTEFGTAAMIGFFAAHVLYRLAKEKWTSRLLSAGRILAYFVVILLLLLTIITRGHPLQPLHYALIDIPNDQFWYFGVPPNTFLHLSNIVQIFWKDTGLHQYWLLGLLSLIAIIVAARWLKASRIAVQTFIFMWIAGALAMVSMLGYYHNSEAYALARMSLLILATVAWLAWQRVQPEFKKLVLELKISRKKFRLKPSHIAAVCVVLFAAFCFTQSLDLAQSTIKQYDIKKIARKTKAYILGKDTNVIDESWNQDDSKIMPIIQADNNMPIVDVNDNGFSHGVKNNTVVVDPGSHASFLRPGQIVYFNHAGRQLVLSATAYGKDRLVTLQNAGYKLNAQFDGAPNTLIVAEDFNHDSTKLWSTYSSLSEDEMGVFNPNQQHADYIIHALGPDMRKQYVDDFARIKPRFVLTLKKQYFIYEEWLQNASWDFYSLLNQNYEAVQDGTMHVLWKRRDQPWVDPLAGNNQWQDMAVDPQNNKRLLIPSIDWSTVPDVNAFLNQRFQTDYDHNQAMGGTSRQTIILPDDQYVAALNQQELQKLHHTQLHFDGQDISDNDNQDQTESVDNSATNYEPAQPKRAVILVKLQYSLSNSASWVPLLGKTARYFVEQHNLFTRTPVSLAPYKTEIVFPVIVSELNHDSWLQLTDYTLLPMPANVKIVSARWQMLDASAANYSEFTARPAPNQKP